MRIALFTLATFLDFPGKTAAFFVEFVQGHLILHLAMLGTPNIMLCQHYYQGSGGGFLKKMIRKEKLLAS